MKRPQLKTQNGINTLNAYLEETRLYIDELEADKAVLVEMVAALSSTLEFNLENDYIHVKTKQEFKHQIHTANELLAKVKGDL